ncbi:hypothetical protein Bca4012_061836 [Brassica carinata]
MTYWLLRILPRLRQHMLLLILLATDSPPGRLPGRYGFSDERNRELSDSASDDGVVLGSPVAPPVNGDMHTDISSENAILPGTSDDYPTRFVGEQARVWSILLKPQRQKLKRSVLRWLLPRHARQVNGEVELPDCGAEATPSGTPTASLIKPDNMGSISITPAGFVFIIEPGVVVAAETGGALGGMVRQLSIDPFENEGRRVKRIFSNEPTVLQLRASIIIFGDLHGQFGDLMRLFDEYGSPSTAGDISYIDYLFLGDYVDRGQHSLETISLLLALKQHNVHLIRGNHEAADINALFGFRIECIERMGERDGIWIENIQRPITMDAGFIVLMDLLWPDPTENDSVESLRPNARGPGLVTFGGHLITLFSATNCCGTANNAGAILVLGRDLVVVPKLIHPLPPAISSTETSPEGHIEDTWMQELNANRPATPTRGRPQPVNDKGGSLAWIKDER